MGKRTLWTGIVIGAVAGGLISLINGETRDYVKSSATKVADHASFYLQHPSVGVNQVKRGVLSVNQTVNNNTDNAINALTQIESSLTKFLK